MLKSKLIISFISVLFLISFVNSAVLNCTGGTTDVGIALQGDWDGTRLYKCNNTFNLTKIGSTNYSENDYYDRYELKGTNAELDFGGQALYIPFNIPQKYKTCKNVSVIFQSTADDSTGLLLKQSYSSESDYLNSLITNWSPTTNGINCVSKTLRPNGKHGLNSYADYASWFDGGKCKSGFASQYLAGYMFSVTINTTGDESGFFHDPIFWFYYTKTDEVCNYIDDNCNDQIDEGVKITFYLDYDGDSFGDPTKTIEDCVAPTGYVPNNQDCDDSNPNVKPTATENTTNGIDDNCNDLIDEGKTQTDTCTSSKPSNSEYNYGSAIGTYTQTWDGINWNPTFSDYHYNTTTQECAWKCLSSHLYDSTTNTCSADLTPAVCTGSPSTNGIWNDGGQNGNYNYRTGEPSNLSANYNTTIGNCNWICGSSYHYNVGACVTNSSSLACDLTDINGSLPSNAKWNSSNSFTQTWNGSSWLPASKKAVYNEVPGECNYACKEPSKNCSPNPETYCGSGVQECVAGNWGNCVPTSATICSQNQYCNVDSCMFCSDGIKNCDSNLLNGCETNIQNDENNCGTCGTICETGQTCTSGICGGSGVIPTDPCENVTCGVNSNCNQGNCVCETGYNNCNGSNTDGCETNGSCNSGPQDECETNTDCETNELCELGNCVEKECETDDECSGTCVSNKCIDQVSKSCLVPEQCGTNQTCVDGYCATLTCGTGFIIKDQACDCEGNVCSGVCYFEEGICCKGTWKSGQSKCSSPIDLEYIEEIVLSSNDDEAIELLDNGKASLANGDTDKANAQFAVAELKAKLVLAGNPTEFAYDYAAAKTALTNGNYFTAESLAKETIGEIRPVSNYNWLITIIVIIIIVGAFIFFIYKKKNSVSIENEY